MYGSKKKPAMFSMMNDSMFGAMHRAHLNTIARYERLRPLLEQHERLVNSPHMKAMRTLERQSASLRPKLGSLRLEPAPRALVSRSSAMGNMVEGVRRQSIARAFPNEGAAIRPSIPRLSAMTQAIGAARRQNIARERVERMVERHDETFRMIAEAKQRRRTEAMLHEHERTYEARVEQIKAIRSRGNLVQINHFEPGMALRLSPPDEHGDIVIERMDEFGEWREFAHMHVLSLIVQEIERDDVDFDEQA